MKAGIAHPSIITPKTQDMGILTKNAGPFLTLPQVFCDFWLAAEFSPDSKKSEYTNAEKEHERHCKYRSIQVSVQSGLS